MTTFDLAEIPSVDRLRRGLAATLRVMRTAIDAGNVSLANTCATFAQEVREEIKTREAANG